MYKYRRENTKELFKHSYIYLFVVMNRISILLLYRDKGMGRVARQ